ncbi:MAG: LacI family DNA-binding transcriptional regulator [Armatimonadaceae bacterium]
MAHKDVEPSLRNRTVRRVTIQDVAARAGVSKTTVSYVLNGRTDTRVPEATRTRVLQAAEALGYRRSAVAACLRFGRPNTIAVIGPFSGEMDPCVVLNELHHRNLVLSCVTAAHQAGLNALVITESPDSPLTVADLLDHRLDGFIIAGCSQAEELACRAEEAHLPCVVLGLEVGSNRVHTDDRHGVEAAVQHLYTCGHRRFAYLDKAVPDPDVSVKRKQAFQETVAQVTAGIPNGAAGIRDEDFYGLSDLPRLIHSLQQPYRPTAIFCYNDAVAVDLYDALRAVGLRIPTDVSVVGFDDTPLALTLRPRLTTVHNPLEKIAQTAVRRLCALLNGDSLSPEPELVLPWLVQRESVAPPPSASSTTVPNSISTDFLSISSQTTQEGANP